MSSTLPPFSDLNATWTFIQPGLEYILGAHGEQGVTATVYMNCYTAVYSVSTNQDVEQPRFLFPIIPIIILIHLLVLRFIKIRRIFN